MQKRLLSKLIAITLVISCLVGVAGTSVSWMGTTYTIPSTGETDWSGPTKVDGFLTSVASNALSKNGGNFTLTADVNFGASFGLLAPYFSARSNAATSGFLRMDNGGSISWRNAANSANLPLSVNSSNELVFNGTTLVNSSGILPVASGGTGLASYTAGDTLYASGSTTLSKLAIGSSGLVMVANTSAPVWQKITDAQVQDDAAISRAKLASGSADHVVINSAAGAVTSEAQLAVSRGGTNISSYTTGDITYASGATTLSKLGIGSAGQVLKVSGGLPSWGAAGAALAVSSKTSGYTLTGNDDLILASSSGGSLTLTLPSAAANSGKVFHVKKTDSSSNLVNISTVGIDKLDGINTTKMGSQYDSISFVSDGSTEWSSLSNDVKAIARYETNSGQAVAAASGVVILDFDDNIIDTTSSVTTGASWKFTAPSNGIYRVSAILRMLGGTGWDTGDNAQLWLYKNNSVYSLLDHYVTFASSSADLDPAVSGSDTISLAAGEYIDVRLDVSGIDITLEPTATYNHISIEKIK